jgi:hypothetical protein
MLAIMLSALQDDEPREYVVSETLIPRHIELLVDGMASCRRRFGCDGASKFPSSDGTEGGEH